MARLSISTSARTDPRTDSQRLRPPPDLTGRTSRFLKSTLFPEVKTLVKCYRSHQGRPTRTVNEQVRFVRDQYLPYLEFDVAEEMRPQLAQYGRVKEALLLLRDPRNRLPKEIAKKADELYRSFDAMGWDASRSPTPARRSRPYPPEEHPIWGKEGIMYGIVLGRGERGRLIYELDDRFTPRDSKVYGHNDLQPGRWFPRQECLRFHGGHSQKIRGISGDENQGAYSIVVSGEYDDIDKDEGDTIYYSGEGARDNNSSKKADVKGNRALRASIFTRNPVRVFRNAKGDGRYAPPCGIRYDGLYEVVSKEDRMNKHGTFYERFKLRRLRDINQPDLEDIMRESPTVKERADYTRIKAGY